MDKNYNTVEELLQDYLDWSLNTFDDTAYGGLEKAEEEIEEVRSAYIHNEGEEVELADTIMCLIYSAARRGITPVQIFNALNDKLKINKTRRWRKNPNGTYSHIKEENE